MDSITSRSFQDVTNTMSAKRRILPHYAAPSDALPTETTAAIEELSGKLDYVTKKVDAIYELLLSLHQTGVGSPGVQPQFADSPPQQQTQTPQRQQQQQQQGENHNVVSLLSSALQQRSSAAPLQPVPSTEDLSPVENHKASSAGRSETAPWMKRDCFIMLVEFKCQRVKRCESEVFISPGHYAIVQGDRGHDCGIVNQCSEWSAEHGCFVREESFDGTIANVTRMKNEMSHVLRMATEEEVERLFGDIARNENLALKTCREIVTRLALDMEVVDCEYQFDQQKISFYYEASRSIDFRQLNSELYRIFGVRIWLQNVNNAVKNVVPVGAMSRADKAQYQKSGLRPPAFK